MKYRIGWLIVLFLTSVTFACSPGAVQPQRQRFTATDLAQISNVYEVAIAPDGDEIAYVSDRSGAWELWTASCTTNRWESRQRTAMKERVSGLAYGPGSELIFCVDHGGDERNDL